MNKRMAWISVVAAVTLLAGCGSGGANSQDGATKSTDSGAKAPAAVTENVTLSFFTPSYVTDEEYESMFAGPTQKKNPNITLNRVKQDKDHSLDSLVAAGEAPDLMVYSAGLLQDLTDLQLATDLEPLAKQFRMDLGQFIPATLDMVKAYAKSDKLIAIPYTLGFRAMYYNRDIFNKFGVPYPKSGMTWDDTIDMARKLTRSDGGVQYLGLNSSGTPFFPISDEMGLSYINSSANKAAVNSDPWKKAFDLAAQIYQIPGNKDALTGGQNRFLKDKNLAMFVGNNALRQMLDLNWDVTSVPTLKEKPKLGGQAFGVTLAVSAQSKHKEAAFQVIVNTLSDEVQLLMVKDGRPSVLKDPKYTKEFGKGMSNVTDQHLSDILEVSFTKPQSTSEFDADAQKIMNQKFTDVVNNGKDSNTALREAEDEINKVIQANQ
jgi:multiple sugar transport system substrate-binding protein